MLRPEYHITPKSGWINDPNGFAWFNGQYHLYAQHYPFDTKWGPMHWLHFTSSDLVHWRDQGICLKPDQPYDREFGCFSGSSIEKDGTLYVFYTGCSHGKQTQCLATSKDGHSFVKHPENPILDENDLPKGYQVRDFRDPKVFEKDGRYYLLLASRHEQGYSSILLYASDDLVHFSFVGVVKSFHNCLEGGMVECPDLLFDEGKCALLYSLQHPQNEGEKFQNAFPVAYVVGRLDLQSGRFIEEGPERELDRGYDCYATQAIKREGKNYIVTWQSSWDASHPSAAEGYAGQLSLVKEARIEGDRIKLRFLKECNPSRFSVSLLGTSGLMRIGNVEIALCKERNRITLTRKKIDGSGALVGTESRYFALSNVERLDVEYVYDHSCVELSFQGGEAFASLIDDAYEGEAEATLLEGLEWA